MQSFSAGACTWPKILLRLQVWNLFAISEQIMRAADCKPSVKKGHCPFLTDSQDLLLRQEVLFYRGHSHTVRRHRASRASRARSTWPGVL